MQRPVRLGQLWRSHLLSREEAAYMQDMAREHFEEVMAVLKALPRSMLLVLRNLNTVRAINTALGAPVDRYFLMAKRCPPPPRACAQEGGRSQEAGLTACWSVVSVQRGPGLEPPGGRPVPEHLWCQPPAPHQGHLGVVKV